MPKLTKTDINRLVDWLNLNGKPGPKMANPKSGDPVTVSKGQDGKLYCHGSHVLVIMPGLAFQLDDRPHLFAYVCDNLGNLWCRYFWTSRSEGCWRAGTGVDGEEARNPFRYKKGKLESSGYVFETQVSGELNEVLENLYKSASNIPEGGMETILRGSSKLYDFFCNEKKGIYSKYEKEVKYIKAIDEGVFGVVSPEAGTIRVSDYQRKPDKLKSALKQNDLWYTLNHCLDHPSGQYGYDSALLSSKVKVERYKLGTGQGNITVEIAFTEKPVDMKFLSKNLLMGHRLSTPVCWVKSVYFDGKYSSFGNFSLFPHDLSFLPQKPMDYDGQVAEKPVKERQWETYGKGTYVSLALFDEKYCPLIREFKKRKNFPLFQDYSEKAMAKAATLSKHQPVEAVQKWLETDSPVLLSNLKEGLDQSCVRYLEGGAGGADSRRVSAFKKAIADCRSFEDLGQISFDLFARIKVGRDAFSGKIETTPSSYLVCFCDALIGRGLALLDGALNAPDLEIDWKAREWEGEQKSILRALLYLRNEGLHHHFTDPVKLEGVLKAMAWAPTGGSSAVQSLRDFFQTPARVQSLFSSLHAAVLESCERYLKGPKHGDHGIKRVKAFHVAVSACKSLGDLGQVSHDLFIKNKVGATSFWSLFGGNINTNSTSYIVYFCDALLMGGLAALDSAIDLPGLKVDWKSPEWEGDKNSILRAILYIRNEGLFHHFETSEKLEGVLKAMA